MDNDILRLNQILSLSSRGRPTCLSVLYSVYCRYNLFVGSVRKIYRGKVVTTTRATYFDHRRIKYGGGLYKGCLPYTILDVLILGPHEEKEGPYDGEDQVRREIQDRQEQMVLPEAQILSHNLYSRPAPYATPGWTNGLSNPIYCFQIISLG